MGFISQLFFSRPHDRKVIEGKTVHPDVSFEINPGSRQVIENVAALNGVLTLIHAGAHPPVRLFDIGMGQVHPVETRFARRFQEISGSQSGTEGDQVYLCSP